MNKIMIIHVKSNWSSNLKLYEKEKFELIKEAKFDNKNFKEFILNFIKNNNLEETIIFIYKNNCFDEETKKDLLINKNLNIIFTSNFEIIKTNFNLSNKKIVHEFNNKIENNKVILDFGFRLKIYILINHDNEIITNKVKTNNLSINSLNEFDNNFFKFFSNENNIDIYNITIGDILSINGIFLLYNFICISNNNIQIFKTTKEIFNNHEDPNCYKTIKKLVYYLTYLIFIICSIYLPKSGIFLINDLFNLLINNFYKNKLNIFYDDINAELKNFNINLFINWGIIPIYYVENYLKRELINYSVLKLKNN